MNTELPLFSNIDHEYLTAHPDKKVSLGLWFADNFMESPNYTRKMIRRERDFETAKAYILAYYIFIDAHEGKKESHAMRIGYGVHGSHCCIQHGCKYGDPTCPVFLGLVKQECRQECCQDADRDLRDHLKSVVFHLHSMNSQDKRHLDAIDYLEDIIDNELESKGVSRH